MHENKLHGFEDTSQAGCAAGVDRRRGPAHGRLCERAGDAIPTARRGHSNPIGNVYRDRNARASHPYRHIFPNGDGYVVANGNPNPATNNHRNPVTDCDAYAAA